LYKRLINQSPSFALTRATEKLQRLEASLEDGINRRLQSQNRSIAMLARMLDGMSPLHTLGRGYAFIRDDSGALMSDTNRVKVGATMTAQLQDGTIAATITQVTKQANPLSTIATAENEDTRDV
jgi:exodeoxyribonuclease VII large subunit